MIKKRIVILAKSAKNNNFCIAGLANTGEYIRPISTDETISDAVPREDIIFPDKTELQILDVVEIMFMEKSADNFIQPENFYYDARFFWKKISHINLEKIIKWRGFDNREKIFYNFERSVAPNFIEKQSKRESLLLLPIKNLTIKVENFSDYKKFYADFEYNGRIYKKFSVGDIAIRKNFENHNAGEYFYKKNAIVFFSLTNPFDATNRCYKMLAQVF